jgi:hypothetical protein
MVMRSRQPAPGKHPPQPLVHPLAATPDQIPDPMPWIVMTDGHKARIMALQDGHAYLIEELCEPHLDDTAIIADPGEAPLSLAHALAVSLQEKRERNLFSALIIMAPTAMLDKIYRHFDDNLRAAIIAIAHKDVSHFDEGAIMREIESLSPEIGYQLASARQNAQL